jgi:hypothetical protein
MWIKNCRSKIPLQLLQRLDYEILLGLVRTWAQTFYFSRLSQNAKAGVDRIFEHLPLKISNAANYEKCVPQKDEQLLF